MVLKRYTFFAIFDVFHLSHLFNLQIHQYFIKYYIKSNIFRVICLCYMFYQLFVFNSSSSYRIMGCTDSKNALQREERPSKIKVPAQCSPNDINLQVNEQIASTQFNDSSDNYFQMRSPDALMKKAQEVEKKNCKKVQFQPKIRPAQVEIKRPDPAHANPAAVKPPPTSSNDTTEMKSMFCQLMKTLNQSSKVHNFQVQPRDRKIYPQLPNKHDLSQDDLEEWMSMMTRTVFSAAFNYCYEEKMTFNQAKVYCSQNIMENMVRLTEKFNLTGQQMKIIDIHLKKRVIPYVSLKYPLASQIVVNKALEKLIKETDTLDSLENDFFMHTDLKFSCDNASQNYNDTIMRILNEVLQKVDQPSPKHPQLSNFKHFQAYMTDIFTKVEDQEWMNKESASQIIKNEIQQEKYKQKVREYTHYLIGRKVSENQPLYTQSEINSKFLKIKSPAMLRLLTKWCEQLWSKLNNEAYFYERTTPYVGSDKKPILYSKEDLEQKTIAAIKCKKEVKEYLNSLFDNNFQTQAQLLANGMKNSNFGNCVSHIEKSAVDASIDIMQNLQTYITHYLNKLIYEYVQNLRAHKTNLITFSIGDLMRCKCSSKQRQIIQIYKQIVRRSQQQPQTFKIIRIKNRLRLGTNDILINVRFNNQMTCQIQLAINQHSNKFMKCAYGFSHYLYQLERSIMGPITELCSIQNSLDNKMTHHKKMKATYRPTIKKQKHCLGQIEHIFVPFRNPFICGVCNCSYSHSNYIGNHYQCRKCQFKKCIKCWYKAYSFDALIQNLFKEKSKQDYAKKYYKLLLKEKKDELPQFGVCIDVQSKVIQAKTFRKMTIRGKCSLFGCQQNGHIIELTSLKENKCPQEFWDSHFIFKIDQSCPKIQTLSQNITEQVIRQRCVLPQYLQQLYKKQKQSLAFSGQKFTNNQSWKNIFDVKKQFRNIKAISLSNNNLNSIDFIKPQYFPNVQQFTLEKNNIKHQQMTQICKLSKLTNLRICQNAQIEKLPTNIKNLKKLRSVEANQLKKISEINEIFAMSSIEVISWTSGALSKIPENINCLQLRVLNLSNNSLKEFSKTLFNCVNLEVLNVYTNAITVIPSDIQNLVNLKELNVGQNKIKVICPEIRYLVNLQKLDFSSNSIDKVTTELQYLKKLKYLSLNSNKITEMPGQLSKLTNLQTLDLSSMKLKGEEALSISKDMCAGLTKLKEFTIRNTTLKSIPDTIHQLQSIKQLNLIRNQLKTLPPTIWNIKAASLLINTQSKQEFELPPTPEESPNQHLQKLCISTLCKKMTIPKQLRFSKLKQLKIIAWDPIPQIQFPQFAFHLNGLKKLQLSGFKIKFDEVFLSKFPDLQGLRIQKSQLKEIPPIHILSALKWANFGSNSIQAIALEMVLPASLQTLDLSQNILTAQDINPARFRYPTVTIEPTSMEQ